MITVIVRTLILYFALSFGIRIMGKRQIADMQPNELVVTLLISEIAAIPLQDTSQPILYGVLSIIILVILEITISALALKSHMIRKLISGSSVVVIKNGIIDQSAMKKVRLTVFDLVEQLRSQNVFDISTVSFAVLEVNGNLSVLLKSGDQNTTRKDLGVKADKEYLPLPVIADGKIVKESLGALMITETDIKKMVKSQHSEIEDIFLMTLDRSGKSNTVKMSDIR